MFVNRFIHDHKKLSAFLVLAALLLASVGWDLPARIRGHLDAYFDLARGHYSVLSWGLPFSGRAEYSRLLQERYGIEERVIGGCVLAPSRRAYAEGYNAVSVAAAKRKFGRDVFNEGISEAIGSKSLAHKVVR